MNSSPHTEDARFLELLQKWQSGDFTRADEQEITALAFGDTFRQEAMEGFFDDPGHDHAATMHSLREWLHNKRRTRRIAFPQLLAFAAALVLVFGAIWFFNIRPVPNETDKIAVELPAPAGDFQKPAEQPYDLATNTPSNPPAASRSTDPLAKAKSAPEKDIAFTESLSKAPVLDEKEAYEQVDDLAAAETKRSEPTQPPGTVIIQSTNQALPREIAEESAARAQKKDAMAKPIPTYNEGKADKAKRSKSAPDSSQPIRGWDAFHAYLNTNARLTEDARAHNVTGTVRLQFRLNEKNRPVDFVVLQKLGYGCDDEAIRLVKDISWIRIGVDPVTVDIPFVR